MFGMIFASLRGIFRLMMFIVGIFSLPIIEFYVVCLCMSEYLVVILRKLSTCQY